MKTQNHQILSYQQIKKVNLQNTFMQWVSETFYNGRMSIKEVNKTLGMYGAAAASAIRN
jgi:hypothetical protein